MKSSFWNPSLQAATQMLQCFWEPLLSKRQMNWLDQTLLEQSPFTVCHPSQIDLSSALMHLFFGAYTHASVCVFGACDDADKALKSTDVAADAIHFNRATCLVHLGRADDAIERSSTARIECDMNNFVHACICERVRGCCSMCTDTITFAVCMERYSICIRIILTYTCTHKHIIAWSNFSRGHLPISR